MKSPKIWIIGIGDDGLDGLTSSTRRLVEDAKVLIGPQRVLASASHLPNEKIAISGELDSLRKVVEANRDRGAVVLTGGDPLFFGTAQYLCDRLGKDLFEVVPHVSSMQLAFARVKENWDDAYLTNLATQPLELVVEKIRTANKVGLFTTEERPPAAVAKALLDRGIDYFNVYVCENIGSPVERVTQANLSEIAEHNYSSLNVMILARRERTPDKAAIQFQKRLFGNPDEVFLQSKPKRGLLTPSEVRAVALAELNLTETTTVWDVGAGSGSVAVEAAQICRLGAVFAIEMDLEDYQLIAENAQRFSVPNLTPILGRAPEAWQNLPDPGAIFVGGSGREVSGLVEAAFQRLAPGGRLIANVGSIENLASVREILHGLSGDAEVWMINLSRGAFQMDRMRFEAMNPTFLVGATKPK